MKRLFDVVVACYACILLLPIFLIILILIRIKFGSPSLFRQQRPGINCKPFTMIKFRSMINGCDKNGNLLPDTQRLTSFGRLLRSTSLDELPTLWNVIKGDMSLVGPRPLLVEYLPLYTPEQARRHEVRPGITGWAQINGRNAISWEDKFKLDVWYVDNQAFLLDLRILCLTVGKVLFRQGINGEGEMTVSKFKGSI